MSVQDILREEYLRRDDLTQAAVRALMEDGDFLEMAVTKAAARSVEQGTAENELEQFAIDAMNRRDWGRVAVIAGVLEDLQSTVAVDVVLPTINGPVFS